MEQRRVGGIALTCGSCLLKSNWGTTIKYTQDLHFIGKLVDESGAPVKNRFVKMFLPNGWKVRTRSSDSGNFRMMLGATDERTSHEPLLIDLGTHVDSEKANDLHYAFYLLQKDYKPCAKPETSGAQTENNGSSS